MKQQQPLSNLITFIAILTYGVLAGCTSLVQAPANPSDPELEAATANTVMTITPLEPVIPVSTSTPTELPTETAVPSPTGTPVVIEGLGRESASLLTGGIVNYPPIVGNGSLWIPVADLSKVLRVDLESGELLAEIPSGRPIRPCCGANSVAFGAGLIWVAQSRDKAILIIDPAANEVVDTIPVGVDVYDLAVDGDTLWVTAFEADRVLRIDVESRQVVATIEDVLKPTGVVVGGGAVWVVEHRKGNLVRINPVTNTIETRIEMTSVEGFRPSGNNVIFAFGSVWAPNNNGETVIRIDPETNEQQVIYFKGFGPLRVTAGDTGVWVTYWHKNQSSTQTIAWIDPEENTVTKWEFNEPVQLFEHEGVLWAFAGTPKGDRMYRIEVRGPNP